MSGTPALHRPAPITAPDLAVPHGFFTREGGVSAGLYASLNAAPGSRDAPANVAENRARVAACLGAREVLTARQVHGVRTVVVEAPFTERPEADALVTATPGLAVGALTADCAPVLLADARAGVVGAAHAGWKGALAGVVASVVAAMEGLGADRARIAAAVGPTISQPSYEVGPEFVARFLDDDPDNAAFFVEGKGDRRHFDLPGYVLARLAAAGVAARWSGQCTYADAARFFSHRRAGHRGEAGYGSLIAAIAPPGPA